MTGDPLVSVIMPLYNKRPYVERSIESVRNQTYSNWELIIVDDGSTDGSADVVPRDDQRIKLLRQANRGPGAARNRAVKAGAGEYLAFIDADDCYYPFKLEKEMDLLWNRQKAEWMMSAYDYHIDGVTKRYYIKDINGSEVRDKTMVFDDALNQLTVAGWPSDGLFMRRTLFDHLGGFNEEMRYGEITEFIFRCVVAQPGIVICHDALYLHINVPGSTAKVSSYKNEYPRQMGESLYKLSQNYPKYSSYLKRRSDEYMLSYTVTLIMNGEKREARRLLSSGACFTKNIKWWKMWVGSRLPGWLLNGLTHAKKL